MAHGKVSIMSKPFTPLTLFPAVWLDASNGSSITSASGSVTEWRDLSGNDRHVFQRAAAIKPQTGAATLNGRNVISFDGTNSGFESGINVCNFALVNVYVVARSTASNRMIICVINSDPVVSPFQRWSIYHNGAQSFETRLNGTLNQSATGQWNAANAQIFRLESDNGDGYIGNTRVLDSASVATLTYPNKVPMRIGMTSLGNQVLNGVIAEVLIFNRTLQSQEKTAINSYLSAKWGV